MKRWFGDLMAAWLIYIFCFLALPKYLWDMGYRKWCLAVSLVWLAIGIFLYGAFRAIFN